MIEFLPQTRNMLGKVRSRLKAFALVKGVLFVINMAILIFIYFYFVLNFLSPELQIVRMTFYLAVVFLLIALVLKVIRPLAKKIDEICIADYVDRKIKMRDLFASALFFEKLIKHENIYNYSQYLMDKTIKEAEQAAQSVDPSIILPFTRLSRSIKIFAGLCTLLIAFYLYHPDNFRYALLASLGGIKKIQTLIKEVKVLPGNAKIVEGEDLQITVKIKGKAYPIPKLYYRFLSSPVYSVKLLRSNRYDFKNIKEGFSYFVKVQNIVTKVYMVKVINRPRLVSISHKYFYPSYTGLSSSIVETGTGDISALTGTSVEVVAEFNKKIKFSAIKYSNGSGTPMKLDKNFACGNMVVTSKGKYSIVFADFDGLTGETAKWKIENLEDAMPEIKIVEPGKDMKLPEDKKSKLLIKASDDFGISKVTLHYIVEKEEVIILKKFLGKKPTSFVLPYIFDLHGRELSPYSTIVYWTEVFDNDTVRGPKRSKSKTYVFRVPHPAEIYEKKKKEQDEVIEKLKEIARTQRGIERQAKKFLEKHDVTKGMKWTEKKKLEHMIKEAKKLKHKTELTREMARRITQKMKQNRYVTPEIIKKMQEIQKLIGELAGDKFKKYIEKLQQLSKRVKLTQRDIEQFSKRFDEHKLLNQLDRTLKLLKRVKQEQRLESLIMRTIDLANQEQRMAELFKKFSEKSLKEFTPQERAKIKQEKFLQKELKKQANKLKSDIETLKKELSASEEGVEKNLGKALEKSEKQKLLENMQKVIESLQNMQMKDANKSADMSANTFNDMLKSLQKAQKCMMQGRKQDIMKLIERALEMCLQISFKEEVLKNEMAKARQNLTYGRRLMRRENPFMDEVAYRHSELNRTIDALNSEMLRISERTFILSPSIVALSYAVKKDIRKINECLENREGARAYKMMVQTMYNANFIALALLATMNQVNASSSASGFKEFMEMMQKMISMQKKLNQMTHQAMNMPMNNSFMSMLKRMKFNQMMIRRGIEKMMQNAGMGTRISEKLSNIAKEMKDIEKIIGEKGRLKEVARRQRKVLDRMLDAVKSIHKQDFMKRRKAVAARKVVPLKSPSGEITERENFKVYRQNLRMPPSVFTRFNEVIKEYFKVISK